MVAVVLISSTTPRGPGMWTRVDKLSNEGLVFAVGMIAMVLLAGCWGMPDDPSLNDKTPDNGFPDEYEISEQIEIVGELSASIRGVLTVLSTTASGGIVVITVIFLSMRGYRNDFNFKRFRAAWFLSIPSALFIAVIAIGYFANLGAVDFWSNVANANEIQDTCSFDSSNPITVMYQCYYEDRYIRLRNVSIAMTVLASGLGVGWFVYNMRERQKTRKNDDYASCPDKA